MRLSPQPPSPGLPSRRLRKWGLSERDQGRPPLPLGHSGFQTGAVASKWKDFPQQFHRRGLGSTLLELSGPGSSCRSTLCHETSLPVLCLGPSPVRPLLSTLQPAVSAAWPPEPCPMLTSQTSPPMALEHPLPLPPLLFSCFFSHPPLCPPPPPHVPLRASFSTKHSPAPLG